MIMICHNGRAERSDQGGDSKPLGFTGSPNVLHVVLG